MDVRNEALGQISRLLLGLPQIPLATAIIQSLWLHVLVAQVL